MRQYDNALRDTASLNSYSQGGATGVQYLVEYQLYILIRFRI